MRGLGRVFILGAAGLAVSACGRFAEDAPVLQPSRADDAATPADAGEGPPDASVGDGGAGDADCSPRGWTSPNGGVGCVTDAGARIVAFRTFNHPALVPGPEAGAPPSDDYTVSAVFLANEMAEFGVVTRMRSDGAVYFGSLYGGLPTAFLGTVTPATWNPANIQAGPAYTFAPGRWRMKVQALGSTVRGKLWAYGATEPAYQVTLTNVPTTGRAFGFYTYFTPDVVLESISFGP